MHSRTAIATRLAAALVALLTAVGCQSAQVSDKTGSDVLVLRLATFDLIDANGQSVAPQEFIDALQRRSGGRIRVEVQTHFEVGSATAETDLVKAIAAGKIDGGWPNSRAFRRAGIRGLEPLEAPLTVTNYQAERVLASGPDSRQLLSVLHGSGVVGLGLAVGPLRRPFAANQPLVDADSWRGIAFRSYNSPTQQETIRALGGKPVDASFYFPSLVLSGDLDGVETDVAQYAHNSYGTLLPAAVGNEVLWPRMAVLALSRQRFDTLTEQQRQWVRAAARDAVQASVAYRYDDSAVAGRLCAAGVRFAEATPEQLASLHASVQPVLDRLTDDPVTAGVMRMVQKAARRYPTTDTLAVPPTCRVL